MSGLERVFCYRHRCLMCAVVFRQGRMGREVCVAYLQAPSADLPPGGEMMV